MVIKRRQEKFNLLDQNDQMFGQLLTRDLFAVANLLVACRCYQMQFCMFIFAVLLAYTFSVFFTIRLLVTA